jgi:hypothetical protein
VLAVRGRVLGAAVGRVAAAEAGLVPPEDDGGRPRDAQGVQAG